MSGSRIAWQLLQAAEDQGREPVRFVISVGYYRHLCREGGFHPHQDPTTVQTLIGIPVIVDQNSRAGLGLVVR